MRDFKEIKVWAKAHSLTLEIYKVTAGFPREERYGLTSKLLLIRLLQQATRYSMRACHDRHFLRVCENFSFSSLPKRPAKIIWLPVAGLMVSPVLGAGTGQPTPL
jgi:hypothetical protein